MVDSYTQATELHDAFKSQERVLQQLVALASQLEFESQRGYLNWRDNIAPLLPADELQAAGLAFAAKSAAAWQAIAPKIAKALDYSATGMIGQDRASLQADIAAAPATSFE